MQTVPCRLSCPVTLTGQCDAQTTAARSSQPPQRPEPTCPRDRDAEIHPESSGVACLKACLDAALLRCVRARHRVLRGQRRMAVPFSLGVPFSLDHGQVSINGDERYLLTFFKKP
eukprot:941111-Prymnesium_polylepis.1